MSVPSFNFLGLAIPERSVTKILMFENWRERNEEIKNQVSSSILILVYTIHPPIVHVCNKFQPSVPEKSVTKM